MSVENGVVLQFNPKYSLKYWKDTFKLLNKIFKTSLIFNTDKLKIRSLNELYDWRNNNYPDKNVVFFCESSFKIYDGIYEGLAEKDIAIIKIQPNMNIPYSCNSEKFVKISWKNATLFACIHEISHMIGLNHCSNKKCIMAITECKNMKRYCWQCTAKINKRAKPYSLLNILQ